MSGMSKISLSVLAAAALVLSAPVVKAYEQYSQNRDATNCRACHGDFRAGNYVDPNSLSWNANLHDLHRSTMLADRCTPCHLGSFFPVFLDNSSGGDGFPAIGCVGCHGRAQDDEDGAGLRQHHDRSGVTECRDCHSDADPANYTPVGENVSPPFYFTPDSAHPNKPTSPCNVEGKENYGGASEGLDNDGDGIYDLADPDCGSGPTATPTGTVTGAPTPTTTPMLTPSSTATSTAGPTCAGDCNDNGTVAINELVTMVNIALESAPLSACQAGDRNGDQRISINELVGAVRSALDGCPASSNES